MEDIPKKDKKASYSEILKHTRGLSTVDVLDQMSDKYILLLSDQELEDIQAFIGFLMSLDDNWEFIEEYYENYSQCSRVSDSNDLDVILSDEVEFDSGAHEHYHINYFLNNKSTKTSELLYDEYLVNLELTYLAFIDYATARLKAYWESKNIHWRLKY